MSAPAIIALDCPQCGRPLPGLETDVAFVCPACARAWELVDGAFVDRPFAQVEPAKEPARLVNLPAWCFVLKATVQVPEGSKSAVLAGAKRATERAAELHAGYALACAVPRADVFGDWGHRWTGLQPRWQQAGSAHPLAGASHSSADAAVLVQHYVLDLLDRLVDVSAVHIDVKLGVPGLLAVPAALDEDRLISPWGADLVLPVHALDGWVEIERQATLPAG